MPRVITIKDADVLCQISRDWKRNGMILFSFNADNTDAIFNYWLSQNDPCSFEDIGRILEMGTNKVIADAEKNHDRT